jgi:cellulose synthase operon protein C
MKTRQSERQAGGCPPAEELAAFLDGQLTPSERALVEEHVADCTTCRVVLGDTVSLLEDARQVDQRVTSWARTHARLVAAGAALAVAAAVLLFVRMSSTGSDDTPTRQQLISALDTERAVSGRLVGFPYQPHGATNRSGDSTPRTNFGVMAIIAHLERNREPEPSANGLHLLGVANLLAGELDSAIETLERATAIPPSAPQIYSDLAAAYVARAERAGRREDAAAALAAADRALTLDSGLSEARFNRALALESLLPGVAAQQAWRDFIAAETDGPWTAEARAHLEGIDINPPTSK